jgi:hypothetical protein
MNDVWRFHQFWDLAAEVVTRCFAFVVDDRYLLDPEPGERAEQLRVGASFGENPFTMDMRRGFLSPEPLPLKYVLGLHFVATEGRVIRLYNMWAEGPFDADSSGSDPARGEDMARALLASVSDERYALIAEPNCDPRRNHSIAGRSPFSLIDAVVKNDNQP